MPLYLTDAEVAELVGPAEAVSLVEAALARAAPPPVERSRAALDGGLLVATAALDADAERAGVRATASFRRGGTTSVLLVFATDVAELVAAVEATYLRMLRAAATGGVAASRLARRDAGSAGVIGCGVLASASIACLRIAVPGVERVVAFCRTPEALAGFCERHAAEPAEYGREAAEQDIVITATSSKDPVLRGEWLRPGALVLACGAGEPPARELDNAVLERAAFVCCDSLAEGRLAAADLTEPVERGVLDWLEVHELAAVVGGEEEGRQLDGDVLVVKVAGAATLDLALASRAVELARERGMGRAIP